MVMRLGRKLTRWFARGRWTLPPMVIMPSVVHSSCPRDQRSRPHGRRNIVITAPEAQLPQRNSASANACLSRLANCTMPIIWLYGAFGERLQVIAWKDPFPKWPIMCRAGRKTLLTHSLTGRENAPLTSYSAASKARMYGIRCCCCVICRSQQSDNSAASHAWMNATAAAAVAIVPV